MDYKMLFLDLDDTLLSSDLSISVENLEAIQKAAKAGAKITICTGRGIFSVKHIAEMLDIEWDNCYIICLNGGAIYKGYPPVLIEENVFDNKSARLIYETAKRYNVDVQIYRDDTFIIDNISDRIQLYIDKLKPNYKMVESLCGYDGEITKILLSGPNDILVKIEREVKNQLKGSFNVFFSNPNYLEFTGIDTTKGQAIKKLSQMLDISLTKTIAIGDSYNDMSMIETAGLGVAVRNAVEALKSKADYITKNTNNEGAVAEVINRYILESDVSFKNKYRLRFPAKICVILFIIEQLIASGFNILPIRIINYSYFNSGDYLRSINLYSIIVPIVFGFVVDYFNQMTRGEDEEEFWKSKYGDKN